MARAEAGRAEAGARADRTAERGEGAAVLAGRVRAASVRPPPPVCVASPGAADATARTPAHAQAQQSTQGLLHLQDVSQRCALL